MNSKEYKIENVADMIKCTTPENLDNFLMDLKGIIQMGHLILSKVPEDKRDEIEFQKDIIWTDDGQHNIKMDLFVK